MKFPRDKNGQYETFKQWSARDSAAAVTSISMEGDVKVILDREVEKRGIRRMEHSPVTAIHAAAGRVTGLSGLDIRSGEFFTLPAKTVIIAAGSGARFGLPETGVLHAIFDCPACAGDSYSLAFRAGAESSEHGVREALFHGPVFQRAGVWRRFPMGAAWSTPWARRFSKNPPAGT